MKFFSQCIFILALSFQFLEAQSAFDYGNGWYDATLPWLKFRTAEDGIYRVTAADLVSAGWDTTGKNPDNYRLFFQGEEQAFYVKKIGGGLDYIEFFGMRNNGKVDSTLYRNPYSPLNGKHDPTLAPNTRYNLFTDSASFFFTHGTIPGIHYTESSLTNYGAYTPATAFKFEALKEFGRGLNGGIYYHGGGSIYDDLFNLNSDYVIAEGFFSRAIGNPLSGGASMEDSLPTPYSFGGGMPALGKVRIVGLSSNNHDVRIYVNGQAWAQQQIPTVNIRTLSAPIPSPLGPYTSFKFDALGTSNNFTDNNALAWYSVEYDRLFNLQFQSFLKIHTWNNSNSSLFAFDDAAITSQGWIWDLSSKIRIEGQAFGDSLKAIIPGALGDRKLLVVTDQGIRTPSIQTPFLSNLSQTTNGAAFVIITNENNKASALQYKSYRESSPTHPLTTRVVRVEEIYDEFSYGSISPVGIKRFCKYALDNWGVKPEYFFLWGKGFYDIRNNEPENAVMTWGYPACDYEFVSNFDPDSVMLVPEAAIGRVCVETYQQGIDYLDKVIDYESTPWNPWMKDGLFLGGGESDSEQDAIKAYMRRYENFFSSAPLGGNAYYQHNTLSGFETNSTRSNNEVISAGLGLIMFFGHSASNVFEIDIKEAFFYQNWNRYPLMIAFGCYGGNFTVRPRSFGENFILEKNRGSIGYLANSTAGLVGNLGQFGDSLIPHLYGDMLGQPIGNVIKRSIQGYLSTINWGTIPSFRNHAKQLNYQGDPSVILYHPQKPDLEISEGSFFLSPENFSAADSVFHANLVVKNLGLSGQDSFLVSIRQLSTQGNVNHPLQKFPVIAGQDTLYFSLSNSFGQAAAGLNIFDVFVDADSVYDEYNELNNRYSYSVLIPGNVPGILYPYDFAVIDTSGVRLLASAISISEEQNISFIFEIDTVHSFNSNSYRVSPLVLGTSWLVGWDVPLVFQPNLVYYWRVRMANVHPPVWANGSFKYMPGKTGWAQSKPPQFFIDPTENVRIDQANHNWEFHSVQEELHAFLPQGGRGEYRLGSNRSVDPGQPVNGVMYCSIDQNTLSPKYLGTPSTGGTGDWAFAGLPGSQSSVITHIYNMRPGDYFLMVSYRNPFGGQWTSTFRNALKLVGCSNRIDSLQDGKSFIILGKKGYPGWAKEIFEPNYIDSASGINLLDLSYFLKASKTSGNVISTTVGPAVKWTELFWDWNSLDIQQNERALVSVYVPSLQSGTDSLVLGPVTRGTFSLSHIDAKLFPTLRLVAEISDSTYATPPQMNHWHIIYNPAPEALVDFKEEFSFYGDTLDDGESGWIQLQLESITPVDFSDSILVTYELENENRSYFSLGSKKFPVLLGNQSYPFRFDFATLNRNFSGRYKLIVEVNPVPGQAELHHFNNYYSKYLVIKPDKTHPVLDVTFDGKHILNQDLVSPEPEIQIEVNDENKYYAVTDTSFELYFGPFSGTLNRVFLSGNPKIETSQGEIPGPNKANLIFRPGKLANGFYELRVTGYDQKGNASGKEYYKVTFEVVNENRVSEVLNYPNPFSTCTRWVYSLTGSEKPDIFKIHVFTVTGRFVKEIDLLSEGEVHVGYTITEYCWNGEDEFGDMLANGVYIYRVICRKGEEDFQQRDEGISEYFKNGFGKLYIMR